MKRNNDIATKENWENLANAIVLTAVKDFREMEGKLSAYADELLETYWHPFGTDRQGG